MTAIEDKLAAKALGLIAKFGSPAVYRLNATTGYDAASGTATVVSTPLDVTLASSGSSQSTDGERESNGRRAYVAGDEIGEARCEIGDQVDWNGVSYSVTEVKALGGVDRVVAWRLDLGVRS